MVGFINHQKILFAQARDNETTWIISQLNAGFLVNEPLAQVIDKIKKADSFLVEFDLLEVPDNEMPQISFLISAE